MAGTQLDTTTSILSTNLSAYTVLETYGYAARGDGGHAKWQYTGTTVGGSAGTTDFNNGYIYDSIGTRFQIVGNEINVLQFGAKGDGSTSDNAAIASALAYANNVYFPGTANSYKVSQNFSLKSNLNIRGDGSRSKLKIVFEALNSLRLFLAEGAISNVTIDGIHIDGSNNYPEDSDTSKAEYVLYDEDKLNTGIKLEALFSNVTIVNCFFTELSYSAIDVRGTINGATNLLIRNNTFVKGNYCWHCIAVSGASDGDANRIGGVVIDSNYFQEGGVQYVYDASDDSWTASADCIQTDYVKNFSITNNTIVGCGGIGIRVERSIYGTVANNHLEDVGQDGINMYNASKGVSVTGNQIWKFGRNIPYHTFREFGEDYVILREQAVAGTLNLPANPLSPPVNWIIFNPYTVDDVDEGTIRTYDDTAEATTLPFRGYAGIAYVSSTQECTIAGNVILCDQSIGGDSLLLYAGDNGLTCKQSQNPPNTTPTGSNITASSNILSGFPAESTLRKAINHPRYMDSNRTAVGELGQSYYSANMLDIASSDYNDIYHNLAPAMETGTFAVTFTTTGGGTVGIDSSFNTLSYVKIGDLVTITGQLKLGAVASPSGAFTVGPLPFAVTALLTDRAEDTVGAVSATGLSSGATGSVFAYVGPGATSITLQRYDAGAISELTSYLVANAYININLTYRTY